MENNLIQSEQKAAISAQLSVSSSVRISTIYEDIVRWLVYGAAFLVPLFYLPFSSNYLELNKQLLLVVVAAIGLIAWLLGVVVTGRLSFRSSPLDKGVYSFLIATLIITILSLTPLRSTFGLSGSLSSSLISVIALSIFYFLAVNTLNDRGRTLLTILMSSTSLVLLIGLCQMLALYVLPGGFTHSRAFQLVGSINTLGVLAAVVLPLFAKMTRRSKWSNVIKVCGIVLSIAILAILNWWALWVIALVGMLALIALDSLNPSHPDGGQNSEHHRSMMSRFIVPVIVIVVGAFLLLVKFNPTIISSQFPVEISPSFGLSWQVAENVIRHRPITGYGPENYSLAFDRFGAGSLSGTQLANVQFFDGMSEAANMLVHGGLVGLGALVLLVWVVIQALIKFGGMISGSSIGGGAPLASESYGVLAATIALLAGMFLYPWSLSVYFLWYVLLALTALVIANNRSKTLDIEARPVYSLTTSLSFIIGLILVLSGSYFFSVRYTADAVFAKAIGESEASVALEKTVKAINIKTEDVYLRSASQISLRVLQDEISKANGQNDPDRASRIQNLLSSSVQLAQRATTFQPKESENWNNLGFVYQSMTGLVDDVERLAEDAFNKAAELRPGDPTYANQTGTMWMTKAEILRQASNRDAKMINEALANAEKYFKKAVDISPSFGRAIYNLGAVYDRQGRVMEAISQLEKIAPYNADEPTLMFELGLLYIRHGQKDSALAALRRAALLAPQFANARWYLALLLEERGDITGALDQLRQIEESNPDNEALKQKIEQLESGQRAIPPAKVIDSRPLQ